MASTLFPIKNAAAGFTFYCTLFAQSDNQVKSNPTLASGDWTISKDGGAFANLNTLPDVYPASSTQVRIQLSQDEINCDRFTIVGKDVSGAEWHSVTFGVATVAAGYDSLSTLTTAQAAAAAALTAYDAATGTDVTTAAGGLPTATEIADAILSRGVGNVEDTADAHSLAAIVLATLESLMSGTTWTIYKTNGVTPFTTKTLTVDAAADPVVGAT